MQESSERAIEPGAKDPRVWRGRKKEGGTRRKTVGAEDGKRWMERERREEGGRKSKSVRKDHKPSVE